MNLIQEFYKNLDALELIIFWGIILVIILIIILVIILINKKKKTTKIISTDLEEEFPIKINNLPDEEVETIIDTPEEIIFTKEEDNNLLEEIEPIIEMNEENTKIETKEESSDSNKYYRTFEMPTAPYQRNVLREMSLSQTSPIGINRKDDYIKPQDLFEMYNNYDEKEKNKEPVIQEKIINKTETIEDIIFEDDLEEQQKAPIEENIIEELSEEPTILIEEETDDLDIERTQYEIEQEENAIISYKELMEKKDSIQTIDEEDAIISIEELLNKTNSKEEIKEEYKLYNISEEEENDFFINELKQFRKDL